MTSWLLSKIIKEILVKFITNCVNIFTFEIFEIQLVRWNGLFYDIQMIKFHKISTYNSRFVRSCELWSYVRLMKKFFKNCEIIKRINLSKSEVSKYHGFYYFYESRSNEYKVFCVVPACILFFLSHFYWNLLEGFCKTRTRSKTFTLICISQDISKSFKNTNTNRLFWKVPLLQEINSYVFGW